MFENDRPLRVADFNSDCAEQEQWRKNNQCCGGAGDIDGSLDDVPKADFVRVNPDVRKVQAAERKETSVGAVEFLQLAVHFEVVLFLVASIKVSLENRSLGLVAQSLDKACVVELVKDFFADSFKGAHVRVQEDHADTAVIAQVAKYVNKTQVRKHRKDTNLPSVLYDLGGAAPTDHVKLV